MALAPYKDHMGSLFTHMKGDFGAISVTKRSSAPCAPPILKASDRFYATLPVWTGIRTLAEVNKYERGPQSTETEVNVQELGVGCSLPNPFGKPIRYDVRWVWMTCSSTTSGVAVRRYSHIKVTEMLIVSLYGCKLQIMVSLGVFGTESLSFRYRLGLCIKKN